MFEFIKKIFGAGKSEKLQIQEISDKIKRFANRFRNAGEIEGAEIADRYSERISVCTKLEQAEVLEKEFYRELNSKGIRMDSSSSTTDEYYHDSYTQTHYSTSSTADDFVVGYTASEILNSDDNSSGSDFEGSGGDFGGAGAESSWEEENSNDNS
ncbi:MAG: hypothetical protein KDK36_19880 [Leptospiraceae bacterium]|nr:hypothetical protein [Leptospiraceae bacterium]